MYRYLIERNQNNFEEDLQNDFIIFNVSKTPMYSLVIPTYILIGKMNEYIPNKSSLSSSDSSANRYSFPHIFYESDNRAKLRNCQENWRSVFSSIFLVLQVLLLVGFDDYYRATKYIEEFT